MKKLTTIALILILTTIALTACAEMYPQTAKVVTVDYDTDTVTVVTYMGFTYTFSECEDWMEGDGVALIMDDNGTEGITDDLVLMARYTAWDLVK